MNLAPVQAIEGDILYPDFRHGTAAARQQRWAFGPLVPQAYARTNDAALSHQQTQCLVEGGDGARVEVRVCFLQFVDRRPPAMVEREVELPGATLAELADDGVAQAFSFDGLVAGEVSAYAEPLGDGLHRLTIRVENTTPFDDAADWDDTVAARHAFASAHTAVGVAGGRIVSLIDPPARYRRAAASCVNRGCFPVLVGDPERCDTLLASPVILHDFPA